MSVAKITDAGRDVLFRRYDAKIMTPDIDVKMVADRIGKLYYIGQPPKETAAVFTAKDSSVEL